MRELGEPEFEPAPSVRPPAGRCARAGVRPARGGRPRKWAATPGPRRGAGGLHWCSSTTAGAGSPVGPCSPPPGRTRPCHAIRRAARGRRSAGRCHRAAAAGPPETVRRRCALADLRSAGVEWSSSTDGPRRGPRPRGGTWRVARRAAATGTAPGGRGRPVDREDVGAVRPDEKWVRIAARTVGRCSTAPGRPRARGELVPRAVVAFGGRRGPDSGRRRALRGGPHATGPTGCVRPTVRGGGQGSHGGPSWWCAPAAPTWTRCPRPTPGLHDPEAALVLAFRERDYQHDRHLRGLLSVPPTGSTGALVGLAGAARRVWSADCIQLDGVRRRRGAGWPNPRSSATRALRRDLPAPGARGRSSSTQQLARSGRRPGGGPGAGRLDGDERECCGARSPSSRRASRRWRASSRSCCCRGPQRRAQRDRRDPRRRGRRGGQPLRPRPLRDVPGVRPRQGWRFELWPTSPSDLGGYNEITSWSGATAPGSA